MRYLVVPSRDTEKWREDLLSLGWLARDHQVIKRGEYRGIPLADSAPPELPEPFCDQECLEFETEQPPPADHIGFLREAVGAEVFEQFSEHWPRSYDQMGDLLILKIPEEVQAYSEQIGEALLAHVSRARLVLQDHGVRGEYRVRRLEIVTSRDGDQTTETTVRENHCEMLVDPAKVYYSPRLSGERARTVSAAASLREQLGRSLRVCDPYAGAGPALMPLLKAGLVESLLANDLNPAAGTLLEANLSRSRVRMDIRCLDARLLALEGELTGAFDLLLVNIPHSSLDHLGDLLPLLERGQPSLLRAWCIIEQHETSTVAGRLEELLELDGRQQRSLSVTPVRSYSPSHDHLLLEAWLD